MPSNPPRMIGTESNIQVHRDRHHWRSFCFWGLPQSGCNTVMAVIGAVFIWRTVVPEARHLSLRIDDSGIRAFTENGEIDPSSIKYKRTQSADPLREKPKRHLTVGMTANWSKWIGKTITTSHHHILAAKPTLTSTPPTFPPGRRTIQRSRT